MRAYRLTVDKIPFTTTLKQRVSQLFTEQDMKRSANYEMVLKTITALSIYLLPYLYMMIAAPASYPLLAALWIIMGFGMAFIGTSVMHDSLHGSYSNKRSINYLLGVSAWLVGVDPTVWKLQHNVLHHSYPNVEHMDDDINPRYVLRLSPNQPRRWFHRFQHIYAIFLYSISTLIWVTAKDFVKIFRYNSQGLLKKDRPFIYLFIEVFLRKASYLFVFLYVPIVLLPFSTGMVILLFVFMHLTAGICLSLIFQPAHVIHTSEFIDPDVATEERNWYVHQLHTTSNFGINSRLVFWFSGGLNHQIEHHLFPNICHIHYRKISKIVRETALEYELPYHTQKTFGHAIYHHFKMLKDLGNEKTRMKISA